MRTIKYTGRLESCPFCGYIKPVVKVGRYSSEPCTVACNKCHAKGAYGKDADEAVRFWNNRVPFENSLLELSPKQLNMIKDAIDKEYELKVVIQVKSLIEYASILALMFEYGSEDFCDRLNNYWRYRENTCVSFDFKSRSGDGLKYGFGFSHREYYESNDFKVVNAVFKKRRTHTIDSLL